MAERIHPAASKPPTLNPPPARAALNGGGTTTNGTGNPAFPPTKSQLYGANRPTYRPQPKPRRYRRSCCCACFLWTTLVIILLLLIGAIGGGVLYVIYRPQRPSFTLTTLKFNQLNITTSAKDDSSKLNSKIDLSLVARNPNKDLVFLYDQIHVSVFSTSGRIVVGDGSFNGFVHGTKNTTILKSKISSKDRDLVDPVSTKSLSTDLKKKGSLFFNVELDTKVGVKISGKKMKKIGIRIKCDQIKAIYVVSKGKNSSLKGNSTLGNSTTATGNSTSTTAIWRISESSDPKCKVNLRIKIWKFTF